MVHPSLVLVETLTMFCSVREVMERKETQAPQQSKPTVAKPGFNMCENLPNFSTAKYLKKSGTKKSTPQKTNMEGPKMMGFGKGNSL